jgi:2'-5' RNA ligase
LRVGWEKPEKLHLTMKFLGDTDENQLKKLHNIAQNIATEILRFICKSPKRAFFPSARKCARFVD